MLHGVKRVSLDLMRVNPHPADVSAWHLQADGIVARAISILLYGPEHAHARVHPADVLPRSSPR